MGREAECSWQGVERAGRCDFTIPQSEEQVVFI
jgi:hypothetical protein